MFSTKPFKSVLDLLKAFPNEKVCIEHLEYLRWNGNVVSPFDKTSTVYKCKNHRYKCRNTNKYFNVRTNTIFEGSKIPLQTWFLAIYLFTVHKKGISSYNLAEELDITQKSAWFLLSRIRYAMEHETFLKEMEGVVEIDETFIGGKNKNRHWDKKIKGTQGRSFKDKTPVVGFLSNGKVKCEIIKNTNNEYLQPCVIRNVKEGSLIVTDDWRGYRTLGRTIYEHQIIDHSSGRYKNDNGFSTNRIENYWSVLKRGIIGIYHNRVSPKHLKKYLDEYTFRFNFREKKTSDRFNILLQSANNRRLTYNALIGKDNAT